MLMFRLRARTLAFEHADPVGTLLLLQRPCSGRPSHSRPQAFYQWGYYEENGAPVCETHHWDCETTKISVEEVRLKNGIVNAVLPPDFEQGLVYNKWGNQIVDEYHRIPGPLGTDLGCIRALTRGGYIGYLY